PREGGSTAQDMTLADRREAKQALETEIGPSGASYAEIGNGSHPDATLGATLAPAGIARGVGSIGTVTAHPLRELIAAATARWEQRRDQHEAATVNKLALAIIRLTHEQGSCTDAALRQEFSAETVKRYGEAAAKR